MLSFSVLHAMDSAESLAAIMRAYKQFVFAFCFCLFDSEAGFLKTISRICNVMAPRRVIIWNEIYWYCWVISSRLQPRLSVRDNKLNKWAREKKKRFVLRKRGKKDERSINKQPSYMENA